MKAIATTIAHQIEPINDVYPKYAKYHNSKELMVEKGKSVSYLMFDLSEIVGMVRSAELELTIGSDDDYGEIRIQKGKDSNWTEINISDANSPRPDLDLGKLNQQFITGERYRWKLNADHIKTGELLSVVVSHTGGGDISLVAKENQQLNSRPQLTIKIPKK